MAVLFAAGLALVGGRRALQDLQAKEAAPELTPVERVASEFGSTDDPGLRRDDDREVALANLYGLNVRTIVVDAGHGGRDPGTIGPTDLMEKTVTLDVARRLTRRLDDHGYRILMTRDADEYLTLRERVDFANEKRADLFVSLHVNWLPVDTLSVIETFFFSPRGTAQTERLAEMENRESGYSMAEWKGSLAHLGRTMKTQESKELASSIQSALFRNIYRIRGDVVDWGIKPGPFMVLWGVEASAVLVEISVISHPADETRLYSSEYREHLAMSLESGVVHYLQSSQ